MSRIQEVERAKLKTEMVEQVESDAQDLLNKFNEAKSAYKKAEQDLNNHRQHKKQIINDMINSERAAKIIQEKAAEAKEEADKLYKAALADDAEKTEVLREANAAKIKADTSMQNYMEFLNAYVPNKRSRGSQE